MYKKIIKTNCDLFENEAFSYLNVDVENEKATFPFASFLNEDFNKQKRLSVFVERLYWKLLANRILKELFEFYNIKAFGWPDEKDYTFYQGVRDYEQNNIEFEVTNSNSLTTKYRYTIGGDDSSDIVTIDFRKLSDKKDIEGSGIISIRNFFVQYFSESVFFEYITCVSKCVSKIDQWYGLKTIPILNKKKFSLLRLEHEDIFVDSIKKSSGYITFKDDMEDILNKSREFIKTNNCIDIFINSNYQQYFLCENEISKCFLTAEYLYDIYSNELEVCMDYSSVVCGYFKSIEILLCKILESAVLNNGNRKLSNRLSLNDIQNMTLDSLINEIRSNDNDILLIKNNKKLFIKLLKRYKEECRNNNLHKDLIDEVAFVNMVRNDTFYIYSLIMTLCNFNKDYLLGENYFDNL